MNKAGRCIVLAVAALALGACASLDRTELVQLSTKVDRAVFNFAELSSYGERALYAYKSESEIRKRYPKTIRVATPAGTDIQYFIEQDKATKSQFIVVRGSANSRNFAEDLSFAVIDDAVVKIPIHNGFDQAARTVYADAKPYLVPGYKTYLTGHSLGAAVAAIMTLYLSNDGVTVTRMVGFGQPRFTTAKGVAVFQKLPIIRVVDENDIVPMLPPGTAIDGMHGVYEQVGPEIILLDGPRYVYLDVHDATRISVGELWRSLNFVKLADHSMELYINRLATKYKNALEVDYASREQYARR